LSFRKDSSEKKIKKRIYKLFRPLIRSPEVTLKGSEDEETILDLEYKAIFENDDELIYKLQILNQSYQGSLVFGG
jgi:hypothetical protein